MDRVRPGHSRSCEGIRRVPSGGDGSARVSRKDAVAQVAQAFNYLKPHDRSADWVGDEYSTGHRAHLHRVWTDVGEQEEDVDCVAGLVANSRST